MAKKNKSGIITGPINCACVIHGNAYSWDYVDKLYAMLSRNISPGIQLHVYTEPTRPVPAPYIRHDLVDWGVGGPKKAWWYKMQLFNSEHISGPLLYFDLDVVITKNLDWIWQLPPQTFWSVRDFKYLWRPTFYGINSSIMWWDTSRYHYVWEQFSQENLAHIFKKYHGDQDYITEAIHQDFRRFFDTQLVKSWRWQALDGGFDFKRRSYYKPGEGTNITDRTSVLVFHGNPKPDQVNDPVVTQYWQR